MTITGFDDDAPGTPSICVFRYTCPAVGHGLISIGLHGFHCSIVREAFIHRALRDPQAKASENIRCTPLIDVVERWCAERTLLQPHGPLRVVYPGNIICTIRQLHVRFYMIYLEMVYLWMMYIVMSPIRGELVGQIDPHPPPTPLLPSKQHLTDQAHVNKISLRAPLASRTFVRLPLPRTFVRLPLPRTFVPSTSRRFASPASLLSPLPVVAGRVIPSPLAPAPRTATFNRRTQINTYVG